MSNQQRIENKTMKEDNEKKPSLLKNLADKHVIVFTVLFWIINMIIWYASVLESETSKTNLTTWLGTITISNILVSLLFLFFAYKVDTVKDIGFYSTTGILKGLLLGLPIISYWIYCALGYASIWHFIRLPKWYQGVLVLIRLLSIGLSEELSFRGVLLPVLLKSWKHKKHGIVYAVLLSSAAFGSIHCIQHFVSHDVLPMTVLHVIDATMVGMFLAAVLLRTHNIWGCIIGHALYDLLFVLQDFVFPQRYIGYMSVTREVNKLLGTSFEVRVRTDWIFSFVFILPIFAAAIIYLRKILKNQDD